MSGRCRIVTLPDGSQVRVQGGDGELDLEYLAALRDAVRADEAKRCHAVGPHVMPEIAQRIHGRETYWCGEYRGHEGPHRWPEGGDRFVWDAS